MLSFLASAPSGGCAQGGEESLSPSSWNRRAVERVPSSLSTRLCIPRKGEEGAGTPGPDAMVRAGGRLGCSDMRLMSSKQSESPAQTVIPPRAQSQIKKMVRRTHVQSPAPRQRIARDEGRSRSAHAGPADRHGGCASHACCDTKPGGTPGWVARRRGGARPERREQLQGLRERRPSGFADRHRPDQEWP